MQRLQRLTSTQEIEIKGSLFKLLEGATLFSQQPQMISQRNSVLYCVRSIFTIVVVVANGKWV